MNLQQYKRKMMKEPEFRTAYEALEPEYALKRRLIQLRMKRKFTQEMLAKSAGTKQSSIARFERGDYSPTISFLSRLARALDARLEVRFL